MSFAAFPKGRALPRPQGGNVAVNRTDVPFTGGPRSALGSAIACGILLSVFEGVGVLISRVFNDNTRPQLPPCES